MSYAARPAKRGFMYSECANASVLACTKPRATSVAALRIDLATSARYCLNSVAQERSSERSCGE